MNCFFHILFSRFIHIVICLSVLYSFLVLNNIPLYDYTTFIFPLISLWSSGLPFSYSELCIYINMCVQLSVKVYIFIFLGYIPRSRLLDYVVTLSATARLFSAVVAQFYSPTNSVWGFEFLHISPNFCYCLSFTVFMVSFETKCFWPDDV